MSEINQESKQSVELNCKTDASTESEVVRKLVKPDLTEELDPDDPRRPGRVDRTELSKVTVAGKTMQTNQESEAVRKPVIPTDQDENEE